MLDDVLRGVDYTPTYDVRHLLNLAMRFDFGAGFNASLRLHLRSGKPQGVYYPVVADDALSVQLARHEVRLPLFARVDAQLAYAWKTSWGRFRLGIEWFNVTIAKEPLELDCSDELDLGRAPECKTEYGPAIFLPNLSLRATF